MCFIGHFQHNVILLLATIGWLTINLRMNELTWNRHEAQSSEMVMG